MELYFIRHAIAVNREDANVASDAERELTAEGIEKMKEIAQGLKRLAEEINTIYTSPLVRARQTADLVAAAYKKKPKILTTTVLSPGMKLESFHTLIKNHAPKARLGLVGHEPDLSQMIGLLTTGSAAANIVMKKGGICRVDIQGSPIPGSGTLVWLLPPKYLRLLGSEREK